MGRYANTSLNATQSDLIARLERGQTVEQIARETGKSKASVYQRLERLMYRGDVERAGKGKYRRVTQKRTAPKDTSMIRRIVLPVTYVSGKLTEQDFDAQVASALKQLDCALNDGLQIKTQQLYQVSSGHQIVYVLHKPSD